MENTQTVVSTPAWNNMLAQFGLERPTFPEYEASVLIKKWNSGKLLPGEKDDDLALAD